MDLLEQIEIDLSDNSYKLYHGKNRQIVLEIMNREIDLACDDWGKVCNDFFGDYDYEFHYRLNAEDSRNLICNLRLTYGKEKDLSWILCKEFGTDDGPSKFEHYCKKIGLNPRFASPY